MINYNNFNMMDNKWITVTNKRNSKKHNQYKFNNFNKYKKKDFKIADDNIKKLLCNNVLEYGECHYGDKCMYAHSLDEQNVEPIRKKAYDIIVDKIKLYDKPDIELAKTLLELTKTCENCNKKKCSGGYNCKYGTFDKKYQICSDDLNYGICYNTSCNNIHLTNKGLKPLYYNNKNDTIKIIKYVDINKNINIPDGILVTEDLLLKLSGNKKNNIYETDSDNDSIERIKNYLDDISDSDKSCDESIFS